MSRRIHRFPLAEHRQRGPRRAGKTLVEMLVLMLILNVIVALAATILIGAMRAEQQVRRGSVQQRALAQLGECFRRDAHRAWSCEVAEACNFTLPEGQSIHYTPASPRIKREIRRGGEVVHRDSFLLGDAALVTFEMPSSEGGRLVRLRVAQRAGSARPLLASTRPAVIEAGLGTGKSVATPDRTEETTDEETSQSAPGEELP
jgi:type II secretory pathway pseudopilin PulG